jgi:hypothetical protein
MTETIKDVLERLSNSTSSTSHDDELMEYVCHRIGFPNARATSGIVYLEGHGTLESPPADIHTVAKSILTSFLKK